MRGQDPDVEALIASLPDVAPATCDRLRQVAGAFGGGKLAETVSLPRDSGLPFAELGPYKLLSRMGEGGMGMVYLAEHQFLRRRVALKIIRPELAFSDSTRQRFQREAMSIAKLRHENIVSVYDAGEHDGVAFLAMELVEGQGLDELLNAARRSGRRMDVVSAVRHARGIALALQCAHEAGIIHRDVKPANVRITPDGRELLLDFGLSLAQELDSLSIIGQLSGTPQYASPEQIELESSAIDARTDVYSLGVTLYECLTGRVPFTAANMTQLFHQILTRNPIEPRTINEGVDETLNGIVMRTIAKRREDRFGSAREMAQALEEWLESPDRGRPTPRRGVSGKLKILAAVLVLGLLTAGWLVIPRADGVAGAPHSASQASQPVGRMVPRNTIPLFGVPDLALDLRLEKWNPLIGGGTFGADLDGHGVIGLSREGISARPYALPGGNSCVRGRLSPIPSESGARTLGAGVGVEFSNGRIVALMLISAADGYHMHFCELLRDGESRLRRGDELESGHGTWGGGEPWTFSLSWNDTDTQFDWGGTDTPAPSDRILLPRQLRGTARPSRFLLIVEKGSARFEDVVLEQP